MSDIEYQPALPAGSHAPFSFGWCPPFSQSSVRALHSPTLAPTWSSPYSPLLSTWMLPTSGPPCPTPHSLLPAGAFLPKSAIITAHSLETSATLITSNPYIWSSKPPTWKPQLCLYPLYSLTAHSWSSGLRDILWKFLFSPCLPGAIPFHHFAGSWAVGASESRRTFKVDGCGNRVQRMV